MKRVFVSLGVVTLAGLLAGALQAGTINVNSTAQSPGGAGDCTLGEAITAANTNAVVDGCTGATAGSDTIMLPAGTYTLTVADNNSGVNGAPHGLPVINSAIIIHGATSNPADTLIEGPGAPSFLMTTVSNAGTPLTLENLTVRNFGPPSGMNFEGGAIQFFGPLIITNCVIDNNAAPNQVTSRGGALTSLGSAGGPLTITDSVFSNNSVAGNNDGGAIRLNGGLLVVTNSTFQNNSAPGFGGAIRYSGGTATITNSTFLGNSAGSSGAIHNAGTEAFGATIINITGSVFSGNSATNGNGFGGGAIGGGLMGSGTITIAESVFFSNMSAAMGGAGSTWFGGGGWTITGSTFIGNSADEGGALNLRTNVAITNSTFSGNTATGHGGAIETFANGVTLTLNNVTITNNAACCGGGLTQNSTTINFRNTMVAGNTSTTFGPDCEDVTAPLNSQGHNLVGIDTDCAITAGTGDQIGTSANPIDPRVRGFAAANATTVMAGSNVGGQTPTPVLTRALLSNSPAIDAGDIAMPGSGGTACAAADQRGVARPVDSGCDIGAFEGSVPYAPIISPGGVVGAASFAPGQALAPGGIVALFGVEEATSTALVGSIPLATTLGGATLTLDNTGGGGVVVAAQFLAPLFFASRFQVNFQLPWELQGSMQSGITVSVAGGGTSPVEVFSLSGFAPGIFAANQQGTGQGAILIANSATFAAPMGSIPGATSRAAVRGVDFLEIYCTGLGAVTNQPASGAGAGANPLSLTTTTPVVTIGGMSTTVLFSGLAPNIVGLYVITLQVPANAPTGNAVPVALTINGVPSNTVTMAVE